LKQINIENENYGGQPCRGFAPEGKKGKMRFMMYRDAMTSQILIKFMTRLPRDA
jgi:hypothetical protein